MTGSSHQSGHSYQEDWYELRLEGHLDSRWSSWLDGMDLTRQADGTTVVRGPVVDQAALHGLLARVRDIGVPLLSVTRIQADPPQHTTPHDHPIGD